MSKKLLLLFLLTIFILPVKFLFSQQIEFTVIGDLGDDNNGEEDVAELVNGCGVDVCFDNFRSVELLFEIKRHKLNKRKNEIF